MISIDNLMISSAIRNKEARVKSFKDNKSARARRARKCTLWSLKNLQVLIYFKLHEKSHVIT